MNDTRPSTPVFTDPEWKTLSLAPVVAFLLVAAADGHIDNKEKQRFAGLLKADDRRPASVQILFQQTADHLTELLTTIASETLDMLQVISEAGQILDRNLDADEARVFKLALYDFAEDIAQSSGGLLAGNIDRHEAQMLEKIRQCLGID